ncbi:MAG: putative membrane protein [Natronomonas sp.]|jgi:uncharacterized membrane protein|uniref:DUF2391 domain-containing protein n=1 Tax=Natronomonas sp. TaxID=2184060 RepID=UPI0039898665
MADADESEPSAADVVDRLESLEQTVDDPDEQHKARRIRRLGEQLYRLEQQALGNVEDRIDRYTSRDVVESFIGSTIFALPLLVEGGIFEIGEHFATTLVYGIPIYFLTNVVFVTAITAGMLYFADFRDVELVLMFGFIPRRLTAVLTISFITAIATMALWGRLELATPFVALCQASVVWTAGSFGAGLGDILPGESEGRDLGEFID